MFGKKILFKKIDKQKTRFKYYKYITEHYLKKFTRKKNIWRKIPN